MTVICPGCNSQGAAVGPIRDHYPHSAVCATCGHTDEPNAFNTASNLQLTNLIVELAERVAELEKK